jgi:transposase
MPNKFLNEERNCIVGMREGGMKSSDIASILNVPRSTVSTILTNWNLQRSMESLKPQCGRHRKLSDHDVMVLAQSVRDDRRQTLSKISSLLNVSCNTNMVVLT